MIKSELEPRSLDSPSNVLIPRCLPNGKAMENFKFPPLRHHFPFKNYSIKLLHCLKAPQLLKCTSKAIFLPEEIANLIVRHFSSNNITLF